jgi:hypothetical protein
MPILYLSYHFQNSTYVCSVAEPHHFDAASAPGKTFDQAPAPILLHGKSTFYKQTKANMRVRAKFSSDFNCYR